MSPHLTVLLIVLPLLAFSVWRRVRTQFGLQPVRRRNMYVRITVFAVLGALIAIGSLHHPLLLEGLLGGIVGGVVLGLIGLRLTRFQIDPVKGDCYLPNPYIGGLVMVLFLGRMLWRLVALSPQWHDPAAAPLHGPEMGQSPLTLLLFGLVVGYYIAYYAGLLVHHERIVRTRQPA